MTRAEPDGRAVAYLLSAAVLAAVLWPLTWPPGRDDFPLSSYPMFARGRISAELHLVYAVALDPAGARAYVPPALVAGREVLQARAVFDRAARGGRAAVARLCREIAGRVAAAGGGGPLGRAVELRVLRGVHDASTYFDRGELGRETVLGRCPVARR